MSEWISVDTAPKEPGTYLVFLKGHVVTRSWWMAGMNPHWAHSHIDDPYERVYPTHWQPLPDPPK